MLVINEGGRRSRFQAGIQASDLMGFLQSKNSFTFRRNFHEVVVIYLVYVISSAFSDTPTLLSENVTKENVNTPHLGTVRHEPALAAGHGTRLIADLVLMYLNIRAGKSIKRWKSKRFGYYAVRDRFQSFCALSRPEIGNVKVV